MSRFLSALLGALFLCLISATCFAITALEYPKFQAFDSVGLPLSGGKVYTYEVGTSTDKTTYSDAAGTVANANPVILDSRGEASIYLNGTYKIVVYDSSDNLIVTIDNVMGSTRIFDTSIISGTSGYIAYYSGTTQVSGTSTISGVSITQGTMRITNPELPSSISQNEVLGGASTYGISASAGASTYVTLGLNQKNGRVGEIKAKSSPIINIGDVSSGVTAMVILMDATTSGNDSGVTIFSPSNQIYEGVGLNFLSGQTIFVNTGNTGFVITLKETSIGWKVWGTDADSVKRP